MEKFLGKYRIAMSLATKAGNPIYLARSAAAAKWNTVVKVFASILLETPQEQDNFVQKIRVLMEYHHRSLLPILDVGVEQENPYIISKYSYRGSLHHRLNQYITLDITEGIQIIVQIGQALQYIHEHNIFHGNIKPENILFDDNGVALLADYAIPCILEETYSPSHAHNTYYPKTELASKQSDQYALSCVAYELFTGQIPPAAIPVLTTQDLPYPENVPSAMLPEHIQKVLYKAMASDPTERYESVSAFIDALDDVTLPAITLPVSSPGIIISSLANSQEEVLGYKPHHKRKSVPGTKRTVCVLLCLLIAVFASSLYFLQAPPNKPVRHPVLTRTKATVAVRTVVVITTTATVPTPTQQVTTTSKVSVVAQSHAPAPTPVPQPPQPQPTVVVSPSLPQAQPAIVPTPMPVQNLVTNPGFEAGNLSSWSCSFGSAIVTNSIYSGAYALRLSANLLSGSQCMQTIAVQPSHTYTLSAYVKGNSASLGVQSGPRTSTSSSSYSLLSVQFTTGASITSSTIYIANSHGGLFGGSIYADNFSVQ